MASFADSYVGRLRQHVGTAELLVPASQVLVLDGTGRMLVQRRTDNGSWEIPGGTVDHGLSFRTTAAMELEEETGLRVDPADLVPFASISRPDLHKVTYANGDVTHAFSLVWLVTVRPETLASATPLDAEAVEHRWVPVGEFPEPATQASARAVELYLEFERTGVFQAD